MVATSQTTLPYHCETGSAVLSITRRRPGKPGTVQLCAPALRDPGQQGRNACTRRPHCAYRKYCGIAASGRLHRTALREDTSASHGLTNAAPLRIILL